MRYAAALALLVVLAGCADAPTPETPRDVVPTASAAPSTRVELPPAQAVEDAGARLDLPGIDWVRMLGGTPWVAQLGGWMLALDPATGQVVQRYKIGDGEVCTGTETGDGVVVAAVCDQPSGSLAIIRPGFRSPVTRVPLGVPVEEEGSVAVLDGVAYVVSADSPATELVKVDLRAGRVVGRLKVAADHLAAVRGGFGSLWGTDPRRGELIKIDPRTGEVVAVVPTGAGARFFDVGEGSVWVQNNTDGTVTRVDPGRATVTATVPVADSPVDGGDLSVGGGRVWARLSDALVAEIDPGTDGVVARYGPPQGSGSVAADSVALWISAHDEDAVYRVPRTTPSTSAAD